MSNSFAWSDLVKDAAAGNSAFEPIPDGDYEFKVIEATHKLTQSQKVMFVITAEVQNGPHAKRRVWDNLVISPENANALGFFFRKMAAMGLPQEWFQQNPSNDQIAAALKGRSFRGKVGHETYNGKTKNNFKEYHPSAPVGAPAPQAAAPAPAAPAPAPQAAPQAPAAPAAPPAPPAAPQSPWDAGAPPAPPAPPAPGGTPF